MVSLTLTLKQEEKTMYYLIGRVLIAEGIVWLDRNALSVERMSLTIYSDKGAMLESWTKDAYHRSSWQDKNEAEEYINQEKFKHVKKGVYPKVWDTWG
jgi:hypothetical protein